MRSGTDLSIIIVNWNTRDLLLQCLESVYQTVRGMEVEVFVVDNGSADGSEAAVKEGFPEVRLVENRLNLGFARANNQALHQSRGDFLLLLNPDAQVKEGAIERLLSFMRDHSETGAAGPQLLNSDGSKQNAIANFPSLATELLNKSLLRRLFPQKFPGKEIDYPRPIEVDSVIGACMIVQRRAMEEVGFLDEDYFLFLEETDWCFQMKKAGWKIYHLPQAEVYHIQGKSAEKDKRRARVEFYRSRYHFFKKNRGKVQCFFLIAGLMVRLGVELVLMFAGCLLTLFAVKKWRRKLSTYAYLLEWHLRLCPKGMGLNPLR